MSRELTNLKAVKSAPGEPGELRTCGEEGGGEEDGREGGTEEIGTLGKHGTPFPWLPSLPLVSLNPFLRSSSKQTECVLSFPGWSEFFFSFAIFLFFFPPSGVVRCKTSHCYR